MPETPKQHIESAPMSAEIPAVSDAHVTAIGGVVLSEVASQALRENTDNLWQTVDAIGFKGFVPKSTVDVVREKIGIPSKKREYMVQEAENARKRASRNSAEYREAYKQARTDSLTGLGNRLAFNELLERQITQPDAEDNLTLLYLDLDGFKKVNDTYGHAVGDELLVNVSGKFRKFREGEGVFRLGGDEFVFVLKTNDKKNGRRKPADTKRKIQDFIHRLNKDVSDSGTEAHEDIEVEGSFGAVQYRAGESAAEFVKRADRTMFDLKDKKKNKQDIDEYIEQVQERAKSVVVLDGTSLEDVFPKGNEKVVFDGKEYFVGNSKKFLELTRVVMSKRSISDRNGYIHSADLESFFPEDMSQAEKDSFAGDINSGFYQASFYRRGIVKRTEFLLEVEKQLTAELESLQNAGDEVSADTIKRAERNRDEWLQDHDAELKVLGHYLFASVLGFGAGFSGDRTRFKKILENEN